MKNVLKLMLFIIPLSFLIGNWWGLKKKEERKKIQEVVYTDLHVLAHSGYFTPEVLNEFEELYRVHVKLTEKQNETKILELLRHADHKFDLVQAYSYFTAPLIEQGSVVPIDISEIENSKNISPDFLGLKHDRHNKYFIPLTWNVDGFVYQKKNINLTQPLSYENLLEQNKTKTKLALLPSLNLLIHTMKRKYPLINNWLKKEDMDSINRASKDFFTNIELIRSEKDITRFTDENSQVILQIPLAYFAQFFSESRNLEFQFPKEGSNLWVSVLALTPRSKNLKESLQFINYLLSNEGHLKLIGGNHQASALASLNKKHILPELKANYIRRLNLNKVDFLVESEAQNSHWKQTVEKYTK